MYAPCLLDDLMDSGTIVGSDVDLGMTVDPVFANKESPSHESDSGCSDMYEDRSVSTDFVDILSPAASDGTEGNLIDGELLDFSSLVSEDDDLDKELATYLGTTLQDRQVSVEEHSNTNNQHMNLSSPEIDVDSDSSDPDYMPVKKIVQARAVRPRMENVTVLPQANIIQTKSVAYDPKHDIRVLPKRTSPCANKSVTAVKPPAVKVVKVIKTAAATKSEVDNELMKALDERNKKNAVQAKLNREKKKAYIKNLEDEIDELKSENAALKISNEKNLKENKALHEEIDYYRSVLANQSALAGLLKNIGSVSNVRLSSSIGCKRSAESDHEYSSTNVPSSSKRSKSAKSAGVCLHVDQGLVSLEFCSKCASMSKTANDDDNC